MALPDPGDDSLLRRHRRREEVLERFDRAWGVAVPAIADYVPADDPDRADLLEALVESDLEHRLRRRWVAALEIYLTRFPELSARRDAVVRLVAADWRSRAASGGVPQQEDFRLRFPDHWADAAVLLELPPPTPPGEGESLRTDMFDPSKPPPRSPHIPEDGLAQPELSGYEMGRQLGHGGMGVVWQARQIRLDRQVAIKVMRDPREDEEALQRLRSEARHIAALSHPNIVQIHEIGEWAGSPFLVMELCHGGSLGQRLRARPLTVPETAKMLESLAMGMQVAHDAGIIHRDLKPDNILLTDSGAAKITDFGLARRLREPGITTPGFMVGTPAYMPPEQTGLHTSPPGPGADIYALGAILYECLTGRPPFHAAQLMDLLVKIISEDPIRPRTLNAAIPRDLETIALKCLQKEPARRYASAKELADDLRRFQTGEPIHARPTPVWERVYRWAARHPAAAALIGVGSLAVVAVLLAVFLWQEGKQARLREERETERADAAEDKRVELAKLKGKTDYELGIGQAAARLAVGEPFAALEHLTNAVAMDESKPFAGFEHAYLRRLSDLQRSRIACPEGRSLAVAWAPDGKAVAVAGTAGTIWLFDLDGRECIRFAGHRGAVRGLAIRPDGRVLASAGDDGSVRLWDIASGKPLREWAGAHPGGARHVVFDPKGTWLASAGADTQVRRWRQDADAPIQVLPGGVGPSLTLAVHPSGTQLLVSASHPPIDKRPGAPPIGEAIFIDLPSGQITRRHQMPYPSAGVTFSATGDEIVCPAPDNRLGIYEPLSNSVRYAARTFLSQKLRAVAVSADGDAVAAADEGNAVALGGYPQLAGLFHRLEGQAGPVHQLAFSPDGRFLASVGEDVRVWRTTPLRPRRSLGGRARASGLIALSPDGKTLAVGEGTGYVALYDPRRKRFLRRLCMPHMMRDMVFTPDGKALVTAGLRIEIWDLETGRILFHQPGHAPHERMRVAISKDGRRLAVSGDGPSFRVWDRGDPKADAKTIGTGGFVEGLAFGADSRKLFVSSEKRVLRFDTATWKGDGELAARDGRVIGPIAISDDGELLAAVPHGNRLHVWDVGGAALGKPRVDPGRNADDGWFIGRVDFVGFAGKSRTALAIRQEWGKLVFGEASTPRIRRAIDVGNSPSRAVGLDRDTFILANGNGELRTYTRSGERQEDWDDGSLAPFDRLTFAAGGERLVTASVADVRETVDLYPLGFSGRLALEVQGRGADPVEYRDVRSGRYLFALPRPIASRTDDASIAPGGEFVAFAAAPRAGWTYDLKERKARSAVHTSPAALTWLAGFNALRLLRPISLGWSEVDPRVQRIIRPPTAVAIDATGTRLALAEDEGVVGFWNPKTGERLPGTIAATGPVSRMAYSPDGNTLAVVRGRSVQLWDVSRGAPMPALDGASGSALIRGVAFSAGGAFAVCREDGVSQVWDTAGGPPTRLRTTGAPPSCVAFSPDGRTLVTGTTAGEVRFWSTRLRRLLCTLPGHAGGVHDIAFSPDGKRMATVARVSGGRSQIDVWETGAEE